MGRPLGHVLRTTLQPTHRANSLNPFTALCATQDTISSSNRAYSHLTKSSQQHHSRRRISHLAACTSARTSVLRFREAHIRTMSSDADYAAFLDKANQRTGTAEAKDASQKNYGTKSVNTAVPTVLEQVEEYYVSDADEPFEPVALKFEGKSISEDDLKKLLGSDKIEQVNGTGFESQYKKVVDAVKQAGNGTVTIFRVELQGTRAEYYVVGVDEKEGRIVGMKALAVES